MINYSLKSSLKSRFLRTASLGQLPRKLIRRYRENETGIAAIEFAIIAPIMIGMYFGLAEVATAISVDRRVSHGANISGDLVTQQTTINSTEALEVAAAALRVMDVPNSNRVEIDIESFSIPQGQTAPVSQGRILIGGVSFASDPFDTASLHNTLLNETSGIVVTRVKYQYETLNLRYLDTTITLRETFLFKPRQSEFVSIEDGAFTGLLYCFGFHYSNMQCI